MINLLPPDLKQEYRYARRNTVLRHWLVRCFVGLLGIAVITAGGVMYLQRVEATITSQAASIEFSLKAQKQVETEQQVQDISSSLKLAVQVLSKEILFSKLLKQLGVVIPSNASLSSLTISQQQSSVDITAKTTDYNAATQLQINLADPANQIFAKADIVSITCATIANGQAPPRYPCTVVVRALFAANNPFLFISNKAAAL